MDVFVIPVGRDRYELYCESSTNDAAVGDVPPAGVFGRLWHRFRLLLHAAEERQHRKEQARASRVEEEPGHETLQDRIFAWMAQRIAEQRLLWNLRSETTAIVVHPQDMTFDQVMTLVRRMLQHDQERHRRWMIVDGVALLLTSVFLGPLFLLVPGVANLPAAYFGFRTVGHWLSMRGAAQGLHRVEWTGRPCPPLSELRDVVLLPPAARDARLHDIATRLRLQRLSTFFERVAVRV
jgi:hypothetical protein